jgi:Tfp pilus assembly major pilin PilA
MLARPNVQPPTANLPNCQGCCQWPCRLTANTAAGTGTINTFHHPSTTNLHTHGLHIDADSPQDSVFIKVGRCRLTR